MNAAPALRSPTQPATEPSVPLARRAFVLLVAIASILVAISGLLYVFSVATDVESSWWLDLSPMFDVANEFNIPTWYSSMLWLTLSLAALTVAAHAPRRTSWVTMATVAALASLDEFAMLHERLDRLGAWLTPYLPADVFSYRWVIVGSLIVILVTLLLAPMVLSLPKRTMIGYVVAGSIFLLGAVVLETAGGFVERHYGQVTWHLMLLIQIEEWLEMVGVAAAVAVTMTMLGVTRTPDGFATAYAGDRRTARTEAPVTGQHQHRPRPSSETGRTGVHELRQ